MNLRSNSEAFQVISLIANYYIRVVLTNPFHCYFLLFSVVTGILMANSTVFQLILGNRKTIPLSFGSSFLRHRHVCVQIAMK